MQVDLQKHRFTDSLPIEMLEAYNTAEMSEAPCKLCKEHPELKGRRIHFHGSDVGACPRQTYFKMIQGHQTKEVGTKAAFLQDGHLHEHMMLQAISNKFNVWMPKNEAELRLHVPILESEERTTEFMSDFGKTAALQNGTRKFLIIGHIDGALIVKSSERLEHKTMPGVYHLAEKDFLFLLECKSVKDYTWDKVKKGEISDTWYGQMQTYMFMLETDRSYLLVKHRNTSELMLPIRVDFDSEWFNKKLRMLSQIFRMINLGQEVPKPGNRKATDSDCKFCNFKDRCYI